MGVTDAIGGRIKVLLLFTCLNTNLVKTFQTCIVRRVSTRSTAAAVSRTCFILVENILHQFRVLKSSYYGIKSLFGRFILNIFIVF